ncbi:MAG TPA: hypothetical protein VEV38_09345, partial [Candidatus Eremiobacteraceae bacterium]|nr:hypothetical protein [Candidatus Eremiobacteraceae bacterium]
MTLILGLKCRGGIVLGADGAATFGALGQRTIRQPTRKLSIIRDDGVVMGTSGPVGLGQQYVGAVGDLWDSRLLQGKPAHTAMMMIQQSLWPHCEQQIRIAQVSQQTFGQNLALQSAVATSVLALPLDGEPRLFQFDHQCAPEEASE